MAEGFINDKKEEIMNKSLKIKIYKTKKDVGVPASFLYKGIAN